jgi:hypothetical protein
MMESVYNFLLQVGVIDATSVSVWEERVFKEIARCAAIFEDKNEQAQFFLREELKWNNFTGHEYFQSLQSNAKNVYAKHIACRTIDRLQLLYPCIKDVPCKKRE